MNLWHLQTPVRAVMRELKKALSSSPICPRHPCQAWCKFQFQRPSHHSDTPCWLLGAVRFLVVLLVAALIPFAQAQSSLILAWDAGPDSAVTGYRLYDGVASGTYTNVIDVGNETNVTVSSLVYGVTYSLPPRLTMRTGRRASSPTRSLTRFRGQPAVSRFYY